MKRLITIIPLAILLCFTFSCQQGEEVAEVAALSDEDVAAIKALHDAYIQAALEGGLEAIVEVTLPAVLTVQTGINEPRYVSIMGIRRAMKKEIKILSSSDIDLPDCEMGEEGSWITVEEVFLPPVEKQAVILEGNPEIVATKIVDILNSKGLT